jgi:hypothetical protein
MSSVQSYIKTPPRLSVGPQQLYCAGIFINGQDLPLPIFPRDGTVYVNTNFPNFNINSQQISNNPILTGPVKQMGGDELVTNLSDDFINFLNNNSSFAGTNHRVYSPGIMTKIQVGQTIPEPRSISSSAFGTTPSYIPANSFYTAGEFADNYLTFWVFRNPITIVYTHTTGQTRYLTLSANFLAQPA